MTDLANVFLANHRRAFLGRSRFPLFNKDTDTRRRLDNAILANHCLLAVGVDFARFTVCASVSPGCRADVTVPIEAYAYVDSRARPVVTSRRIAARESACSCFSSDRYAGRSSN